MSSASEHGHEDDHEHGHQGDHGKGHGYKPPEPPGRVVHPRPVHGPKAGN